MTGVEKLLNSSVGFPFVALNPAPPMISKVLCTTLGLALSANLCHAALVYRFGFEETGGGDVIDSVTGLSLGLVGTAGRVVGGAPIKSSLGTTALSVSGGTSKAYFYSETSPGAGFGTANASGLTLMAFINPASLPGTPSGVSTIAAVSRGGSGTAGSSRINFGVLGDGSVRGGGRELDANGFGSFVSSPGTVEVGQWIHLAVTFDYSSNLITLYANGTLLGSGTSSTWGAETFSSNTFSPGIAIGGNLASASASTEAFNGLIDELQIYNTALTSSEIQAAYLGLVPEPSALLLSAFASVSLLRRRR
jgi:hypothetical protein